MEYTTQVFVEFINKLIAFDKNCRSVIDTAESERRERGVAEQNEWKQVQQNSGQKTKKHKDSVLSIWSSFQKKAEEALSGSIKDNGTHYYRLDKCREILSLITSAENTISSKQLMDTAKAAEATTVSVTLEQLLAGKIDFQALAYEVNSRQSVQAKDAAEKCTQFYQTCRAAEALLNAEITSIRNGLSDCTDALRGRFTEFGNDASSRISQEWQAYLCNLDEDIELLAAQRTRSKAETTRVITAGLKGKIEHLNRFSEGFRNAFPPEEMGDEYVRIYSLEPNYADYECFKEMPRNLHICTLEYDISALNLCEYTTAFLHQHYPFMCRGNKLCIPYCATFENEFNLLFRFKGVERQQVVKNACDLGMRLFMMLPPRKIKFTFIDPVKLVLLFFAT